jgi:ferredoxin-NADP reductase
MESHRVKILETKWLTHDVRQFRLEKPSGYAFVPGQATEVAIAEKEWENEKRPFTFTSLNSWPFLEFTIKIYNDHDGVTNRLGKLEKGDALIIHDVWGAISYRGPGVFIAGGAGITPFIAILRQLGAEKSRDKNLLLFSNKTAKDIILQEEFVPSESLEVRQVLTREKLAGSHHGRIDAAYLQTVLPRDAKNYYVCGPEQFTGDVLGILEKRGIKSEALVFEK